MREKPIADQIALAAARAKVRNVILPDADVFLHISPNPDACDHDWSGWRMWETGGEQVCAKCGMGAMAHSLRTNP